MKFATKSTTQDVCAQYGGTLPVDVDKDGQSNACLQTNHTTQNCDWHWVQSKQCSGSVMIIAKITPGRWVGNPHHLYKWLLDKHE